MTTAKEYWRCITKEMYVYYLGDKSFCLQYSASLSGARRPYYSCCFEVRTPEGLGGALLFFNRVEVAHVFCTEH